ncbi:MAG: hypothetical protein A3H95_16865 [Acidobacteria bacterium RIFCSPLOWO2_02_FULL_64_15]|nr:MAG: hypothetical protein A3H95_16865 [Acidobacteria bacterium RIFCSPLOWO2_02_FULL_64_15]
MSLSQTTTDRCLSSSDIPWVLDPPERLLEQADLLCMNERELLAYCTDLQQEAQSLRQLLHVSVAQLADLTVQQRQQLRQTRERAAA